MHKIAICFVFTLDCIRCIYSRAAFLSPMGGVAFRSGRLLRVRLVWAAGGIDGSGEAGLGGPFAVAPPALGSGPVPGGLSAHQSCGRFDGLCSV